MKNHKSINQNNTTYRFRQSENSKSYSFYKTFIQIPYNFYTTFVPFLLLLQFLRSLEIQLYRQITPDGARGNIMVL